MSSAISASDVLWEYHCERAAAEQVVAVVTTEYYRVGGGARNPLKPVMDVIERAHPGFVELASSPDKPGFQVTLAVRPFPKRYEHELHAAVREALLVLRPQQIKRSQDPAPPAEESRWKRWLRAVRRVFTASA